MVVFLPIQKLSPLALTDCKWMGLAERAAMRPKGVKGAWREERGGKGLAETRNGRRDARMREEYIVDVVVVVVGWWCSGLF